jgi:hypothetical protein
LQAAGLIKYSRGRITVVDRAEVEAICCECYGVVRRALDLLTAPPPLGVAISSAREGSYSAAVNGGGRVSGAPPV